MLVARSFLGGESAWWRGNWIPYQYNIKQTSDENKEKYHLGDYKLIQYEILQTNITRAVWQTIARITDEISSKG